MFHFPYRPMMLYPLLFHNFFLNKQLLHSPELDPKFQFEPSKCGTCIAVSLTAGDSERLFDSFYTLHNNKIGPGCLFSFIADFVL